MPLPSSKNISRKLGGGGGKSTPSSVNDVVENLKLQHAEELAAANDEHAKTVESLQNEIEQCRTEIEALREISDEHTDTFMPLPSPSKTLKYVKNAPVGGKAARKATERKDVMKVIGNLKQQHKNDLTKAAEAYAKRLHSLRREVDKYKSEADALKKAASQQGCDETGVNKKTGVALDKENDTISHTSSSKLKKNSGLKVITQQPKQESNQQASHKMSATTTNKAVNANKSDNVSLDGMQGKRDEKYERLFRDDYQFEKNPVYEDVINAMKNNTQKSALRNKEIDELCTDMVAFMKDVRAKRLSTQ